MTEVKSSPSGGQLGLFATQAFKTGDTILSELHPLVRLGPTESLSVDDVPDNITSPGTFRGMVQAGIAWMKHVSKKSNDGDDDTTRQKILKLYHPNVENCSEAEKAAVTIAEQATAYLKEYAAKNTAENATTFDDWTTLQKILLVWSCNSFQGGRIYETISRVNHSCNPNAVIVPMGENDNGQRVVAATDIAAGTEITISYLGLLLYADTAVRRKKLSTTKYFECQCARCKETQQGAAQIPCPSCHPRHPTQLCLDEEVQYDDDQEVQYVCYGQKCSVCGKDPKQAGERLEKVLQSVMDKMYSFLETYEALNSTGTTKEDSDENHAVLEEHVGLASTMMGNKHWTTNLTLLLHLDRRLSTMSKQMLTTQELPEMEEVAEAIDSLQRVYQYIDSLQLDLDKGHILGDVTIGVARTLVSLGDEKSQKYGAEWLDKIGVYVETFGDEGLQKVVAALKWAWKKRESNGNDHDKESKKLKTG
ncbi:MAG: hypothetical protein SGILL_004814 [Bacillariaceae sp.]